MQNHKLLLVHHVFIWPTIHFLLIHTNAYALLQLPRMLQQLVHSVECQRPSYELKDGPE